MISDLVGIPYVRKGRAIKGADCFGLVKLYYKHILNIDIEDVNIDDSQTRKIFANYLREISRNWKQSTCVKHSVVAMATDVKHPNLITHFGVMLDDKHMLHTDKNSNSHVIKITHDLVKNKIKGFYQWQH